MILPPVPEHGIAHWQTFTPIETPGTNRFVSWLKPVGATMIVIIAVGPGGGGGGGQSTAAAARAGGGGGGCGSVARIFVPAWVLPDVLFISPGPGATGGTAANNGGNTQPTYVAVAPDTTMNGVIVQASNGTSGQAVGTAGSAGTAILATLSVWGVPIGTTGQAGGAGGANTGAVGTNLTPSTSLIMTAGAGGAGSSTGNNVFAGGDIVAANPTTGVALWKTLSGGVAGVSGSAAGGNGQAGLNHSLDIMQTFSRNMPLIFSGGSGGGSGGASNGGNGGPGAWGCGGGGGGAGATGGAGGKGGDGFVIIGAF